MSISKAQRQRLKLLGKRVKEIREAKSLTLRDVAHAVGKDPQSVHRVEMGEVNPSYLYLMELCKGLDIDIIELLKNLD